MANNKQVMDIRPSKGAYPEAVGDEQTRNWTERQWDYQLQKEGATYDPTRTHLNFEIARGGKVVPIGTNKKIGDRFKERCNELGISDPNFKVDKETQKLVPSGRVTTAWIIFGGSSERMNELAFGSQKIDFGEEADNSKVTRCKGIERWAKDVYRFACEHWGEENIIGFNIHLDEMNVHCHCTVMPVAMVKGKPNVSFNKVFYTPKNMKTRLTQLHDELAVVNSRWGLERGTPVAETGARHKSKEEYLREKAQMEKAVKGLTTMIGNLEAQRNKLQEEIKQMQDNYDTTCERYQSRILELQEQLMSVQDKMEQKQQMLATKERQIADIEKRIRESQAVAHKIERAVHDSIHEISPVRMLAFEVMLADVIDSMRDVWDNTSTSMPEDDYMDESFAGAVISNPNTILKTAFYLFCGMVNEATNIARNSGGGGGTSSDLPWRKKDEDDIDFMRRCMQVAAKMARPRSGYKTKKGKGGRGI